MARSWFLCLLLRLCVVGFLGGIVHPSATTLAEDGPASDPRVLYVRTEFLPYKTTVDRGIPYRMGREIVRQAVLLAARDELGWGTCDETLHETLPRTAAAVHVMVMERADLHGKWNVKLIPESAIGDVWEKTYDYIPSGDRMYADMIPKLEADTRGAFREALLSMGVQDQQPAVQDPQPPGQEIEKLLGKVDFISQFGAVRAAHQAIGKHGETPEWLSVLVRGYAHLALLTRHHWSTATEVFSARSWLYAQRMYVATGESDLATWHRAYAWAFGGALQHALENLAVLTPEKNAEDAGNALATPPGSWASVVEPYCRFDRGKLIEMTDQDASEHPWALPLWFEIVTAYREPFWIFEVGQRVHDTCPAAYHVYYDMVHHGGYLSLMRTGDHWGWMAFAEEVPKNYRELPEIPQSTSQLAAQQQPAAGWLPGWLERQDDAEEPPAISVQLAGLLREETAQTPTGDLSWSALASLLEDEQFVLVASHLSNISNAVEQSLADEVAQLMPLVAKHRFAKFIEAHRYNYRRDHAELQELLQGFQIPDPRMNMVRMYNYTWNVTDASGQSLGHTSYGRSGRNFTLPGMTEYCASSFGYSTFGAERDVDMFAREYRAIAPHADIATQIRIMGTKQVTVEELKAWENELRESPSAFSALAARYAQLREDEAAIRCYERSLELVPNLEATLKLAQLYEWRKEWEKWEKTLLAFLDSEDLGLQHSTAQQALAYGYANRGLWRKARPYAVAAAEVWSSSGLQAASHICEGLAEWEDSEQWMRSTSEAYPSLWGYAWYFWCRRNGRGDERAAADLAARHFAAPLPDTRDTNLARGTYCLLQSNLRGALEQFQKASTYLPSYTCTFTVAQVARELGEEQTRLDALDDMEKAIMEAKLAGEKRDAKVDAAGMAIIEFMRDGKADQQRVDQLEALITPLDSTARTAFAYYIAKELDHLGQSALTDNWYRRALVQSGRETLSGTLAGAELARRHGTSRPNDDVLDETDLWPAPVEEKPKE